MRFLQTERYFFSQLNVKKDKKGSSKNKKINYNLVVSTKMLYNKSDKDSNFGTSEQPIFDFVPREHRCGHIVLLVSWGSWDCHQSFRSVRVERSVDWIELFDVI